jgi:hypothetical protein
MGICKTSSFLQQKLFQPISTSIQNYGKDASAMARSGKDSDSKKDKSQGKNVGELLTEAKAPPFSDFRVDEFPSDVNDSYKQYYEWKRVQGNHSFRPSVDPRSTSIILFPGQGSHFVGMGRKLLPFPNVRDMYDAASNILGYDLLNLCLHGPKEELMKTANCQPAMFVTSLAAVEKLKEDYPQV